MNSPLVQPAVEAERVQPLKTAFLPVEPDKALEALLHGFLGTIAQTTGATAGVVYLVPFTEEPLVLAAGLGLPALLENCKACRPLGCGICSEALEQGRIMGHGTQQCAQRQAHVFSAAGYHHVNAIPLQHCGSYLGLLTLFWASAPSPDITPWLTSAAAMLALALNSGRLSQDNQRVRLMAERQAIANEIHDSLSQSLFFGRLRMSVLTEAIHKRDESLIQHCLEDIGEALDSGQKSVRELIAHFRSPMDPLGLHHALKMLIDELKTRTSIIFDYDYPLLQHDLTLEQEMQIFHILRESLNNLVIHSQATHARLSILEDSSGLHFEVTDNGIGLGTTESPIDHYGLTIMKERARRVGAQLFFHSASGVGTQIRLHLPHAPSPQE